jgi:hypothetical protein
MKRTLFALLFALLFLGRLAAIEGRGDLYVLHNADGGVRIIAAQAGGILDTTFAKLPENFTLRYTAAEPGSEISFTFGLHKRVKHAWRQKKPAKTLVVSDLHGRLDAFAAFLKGNGVVDDGLHWIYGNNQLIFLGDFLDRGRDDNGIAWLLYKLEKEAEDAGGRLDFIPGNHEDLVLKDDIRYVHEDHLMFAAQAGIPYSRLYGADTELGRWIRDSYLILIVENNLFVHAGLSPDMENKSYKTGEINELGMRFLGIPTAARKELHARNELLFGSNGPLWYRGLASDAERHEPLPPEELRNVLKYYGVSRIIVGHTEVNEVERRYDGQVIAVNVRHHKNFDRNGTAGLLIEGDNCVPVNYTGDVKDFLTE